MKRQTRRFFYTMSAVAVGFGLSELYYGITFSGLFLVVLGIISMGQFWKEHL